MERIHHRDIGQDLVRGGGLESEESVRRDDLGPRPPDLRPLGDLVRAHRLRAALDHAQQFRRTCPLAGRGEDDDDGDELVAAVSVPSAAFVDTDPGGTSNTIPDHRLAVAAPPRERWRSRCAPGGIEACCDPIDGEVIDRRVRRPTPRCVSGDCCASR